MKNLIYIAFSLLTALSLSACKSSVTDEPENPTPSVPTPLNIGVKSLGASGNAEPLDKFGTGDQISLFLIHKANDDQFVTFDAFNYKYGFATPTWIAFSSNEQLMWPDDVTPIYIYGIHPAPDPAGAITQIEKNATDVNAQFKLPTDQSNITLKKFDLMRSENKGTDNNGLIHEVVGANPVSMSFKHKLCKIQFGVVVTKDNATSIPTGKVNITQIRISGTQIATNTSMSLKTGTLTTDFGTPTALEWNGNKELTLSANYNDNKTVITDMLLIPFEPVERLNMLSFTFKYNDGTQDVERILTAPITKPITSNDISYTENQYNIVKITANMTDSKIGITADIVDWNKEDHEIEPI